MRLKSGTRPRTVMEVGEGDYIFVWTRQDGYHWERIVSNSAFGAERTPRNWTIVTTTGASYDMFQVNTYAKADDMQD